jgi:hypothetical protein
VTPSGAKTRPLTLSACSPGPASRITIRDGALASGIQGRPVAAPRSGDTAAVAAIVTQRARPARRLMA